jgi:hypothetical protein
MRIHTLLRSAVVCGCLTAGAAAFWLGSNSLGDPLSPAGAAAGAAADAGNCRYVRNERCFKCHIQAGPDDKVPDKKDGGKRRIDFMGMDEYATWQDKDRHSQAYAALTSAASKRIAAAMPLSGGAATADSRCLSCHSMNVSDSQCESPFAADLQKSGVGCQACHGPASLWRGVHDDADNWRRILSTAQKAKLGLVDLRDPVVRAEKCLSCHLGNPAEGKVVTHEMYSAGHPPVPGFEVQTCLDAMPRHWKPQDAQPKALQDQYNYSDREKMRKTRFMVIGGLVAVREYARLVAFYANEQVAAARAPRAGSVVELGAFDCQACHHELTADIWRQSPAFCRYPGRPAPRSWPLALGVGKPSLLGRIALSGAGERTKLPDALKSLDDALAARPFGDPKQVLAAASAVEAEVGAAIDSLRAAHFDDKTALDLARAICRIGAEQVLDFESARQLAWAFKVITDDDPKLMAMDVEAKSAWTTLCDGLTLDIPKRSNPGDKSIEEGAAAARFLEKSAHYRPKAFAAAWAVLGNKLLPKSDLP